jgi:hypothetical protein
MVHPWRLIEVKHNYCQFMMWTGNEIQFMMSIGKEILECKIDHDTSWENLGSFTVSFAKGKLIVLSFTTNNAKQLSQ